MHFRPQAALQKKILASGISFIFSFFLFFFFSCFGGDFRAGRAIAGGKGVSVLPEEHRLEGGGDFLQRRASGNHGRRGTRSGSRRSDHREDARAPRGVLGGWRLGRDRHHAGSKGGVRQLGRGGAPEGGAQGGGRPLHQDCGGRQRGPCRREEEGRPARDRRARREEEGEDHGVGLCTGTGGGGTRAAWRSRERSLPRPSSTTERSF